jgi:GntR family transcriptional regulator
MVYIMLNPKSNIPIYEQIIRQYRERIVQGVVKPGDKVPSIRELSSELAVNPNTVSKAYKELERIGTFITYRGKGTFINDDLSTLESNEEKDKVKKLAKGLVIDCIYAGVTKGELVSWINEYYQEMGGEKDD